MPVWRVAPWQTYPMQAYLPIISSELLGSVPPNRQALLVQVTDDSDAASREELAEDVRDEAAWQSLILAREAQAQPTRLVAGGVMDSPGQFASWSQIDELYVDDEEGRRLAAQLFSEETQDGADHLMEMLFAEPLMWFDISERKSLGDTLVGAKPFDEV